MARTTARNFPTIRYPNGVGLGALEEQWGQPAAKIRQWIADGLLAQNADGTIANKEVHRFNREHGDLLV
jgi:hypothetical protein